MKFIIFMYIIIQFFPIVYTFLPNTYFKCCQMGEQLAENKQCVPCPRNQIFNTQTYGRVAKENEPLWVPESARVRGYRIRYGVIPCPTEYRVFLPITEHHVINISSNGTLTVHSKQRNVINTFQEYCFDFMKGGYKTSIAILGCMMNYTYIDKCCPLGQYVSTSNGITKCENRDISRTSFQINNKTYPLLYRDINYYLCDNSSLKLFEDSDEGKDMIFIKSLTHRLPIRALMQDRITCMDTTLINGNLQSYTHMYCRRSQILRGLYEISQPLTLVAAFCLLLVLLTMCTFPELRSSSPGKALCCHIFCLLMVYLMRTVSFFSFSGHDFSILQYQSRVQEQTSCRNYALATYFFLTASCIWLNALSIDIADRFRRLPVGVIPTGDCQRFVIFALYAWGATVALTVRCGINAFGSSISQAPTFQETRTCYYESQFSDPGGRRKTLEYYYGPMGVLFLVNLALYAYIAVKLFKMYEETSLVDHPETPTLPHRSAMVLVRLLLLMGGIEWAAEMTGWGTRSQPRPGRPIRSLGRLAHPDDVLQSEYALRLALNLLDVLRAVCLLWVCCGRPRVRRKVTESLRRAMSGGPREWRWRCSSAAHASNNIREVSEFKTGGPNQVTPTSNGNNVFFSFPGKSLRQCCLSIPSKLTRSPQPTIKENSKKTCQELEMQNMSL